MCRNRRRADAKKIFAVSQTPTVPPGSHPVSLGPHVEDVRITAKLDQLLEPLPEAGSYLGFVFARAPQPSEAEAAVREAHRRLVFTVDEAIEVRAG